ncbi:MAG: hypothetical protein ABIG95_06270 [Candidatus Woesearchaeota archaeon]
MPEKGDPKKLIVPAIIMIVFFAVMFMLIKQPAEIPMAEQPAQPTQEQPELIAKPEKLLPKTYTIILREESATPNKLTIYVGDTVVWENLGANRRRFWINEKIYSELLDPQQAYSYTFRETGEYYFRDVFNGLVTGTIIVKARDSSITGNFWKILPTQYKGVLGLQLLVLVLAVFLTLHQYKK